MTRVENQTRRPSKTRRAASKIKALPLFAQWIEALGFNKKEVSKAGALLGLSTPASVRRNLGQTEPTLAERLAMTAVRLGLEPWSPELEAEFVASGQAVPIDDDQQKAEAARRRLAARAAKLRTKGMSYAQIGKRLGVSGEWARKLVATAAENQ